MLGLGESRRSLSVSNNVPTLKRYTGTTQFQLSTPTLAVAIIQRSNQITYRFLFVVVAHNY